MLLTGFALLLAGCKRAPAPVIERTVVICATEYPLADIAREVGGDRVQVDWLIDLGDPIVTFTLNDDDRARLRRTDLVLVDGAERTEPWAAAELGRVRGIGQVLACNTLPITQTEPAAGILYLDPMVARAFALQIADTLVSRVPRYADEFRQRATDYAAKIDSIVAGYPNASFGKGKPVLLGNLFAPLLDRFGITPVVIDADPLWITPTAAATIRTKAADAGSHAIIVPFDTPAGTRTDLAQRTGLTVFALDPLGYRNFDQHASYLDVLRFNLDQLKQATLQQ